MSTNSTKCPKCALKAVGEEEIELKFGWRESKGKKILQSWCRRCRSGQSIEEPKEDKKEHEKSLRTNLQSYADRLHDLDSLKLLLTRPDGLNFKFKKNGDKEVYYFAASAHPNKTGSKKIAEVLATFISKNFN